MSRREELARARADADTARADFRAALSSAALRISPGRLKDDAAIALTDRANAAKRAAVASVKQRPVLAIGIAGALATLLLWKPVRGAIRRRHAAKSGLQKVAHAGREAVAQLRAAYERWRMRHGKTPEDDA